MSEHPETPAAAEDPAETTAAAEDPGEITASAEDPAETTAATAEDFAEITAAGITGYYFLWGERHLRKRRWAKAATAFRRCLGVHNLADEFGVSGAFSRSQMHYKLGLALEQIPDLPKAAEALEQAIEADPGEMAAREALARVAIERSDFNGAIQIYNEAYAFVERNRAKYGPAEVSKIEGDILTQLGSLLIEIDEYQEAGRILSLAISIRPENQKSLAYYAIVAGKQGKKLELRKYLGLSFERCRPGIDGDLIDLLLQDAASAEYGGIVLDMLISYKLILNSIFTLRKQAWQRNQDELHRASDQINVSLQGAPFVNRPAKEIYDIHGNVGNAGRNGINVGIIQNCPPAPKLDVDLHALANDLALLNEYLGKQVLSEGIDPDHLQAMAALGFAKKAADESDQTALIKHLKASGQWALDAATKIGTSVAEAAIRAAFHFP